MFFEQYEVEPTIAVARFWVTLLGERDQHAEELEAKWRGGNQALAALDGHLDRREWLVGGRFTIADISLYAYTHVAHQAGLELDGYPRGGRGYKEATTEIERRINVLFDWLAEMHARGRPAGTPPL